MSRGCIGPKNHKQIGKSTHHRAIVCPWTAIPLPVLLNGDPILTLNLHIHHGSAGLEASCQHNHVCRNDAVCSLNPLWDNFGNLSIGEE